MLDLQNLFLFTAAHTSQSRKRDAFADPLEGPEWAGFAPNKPFCLFPF